MGPCPAIPPVLTAAPRAFLERPARRLGGVRRRRRHAAPGRRLVPTSSRDGRILLNCRTPAGAGRTNLQRDPRVALSVIDLAGPVPLGRRSTGRGRGHRRRRPLAGRHRRARPPLRRRTAPTRASHRHLPDASRGSRFLRPDRPASTTTSRTDAVAVAAPVKIGFLLWSQTDRWPALRDAAVAAERRRGCEPLDVGPPHGDLRAVGAPDPRGLVDRSPAGPRVTSARSGSG